MAVSDNKMLRRGSSFTDENTLALMGVFDIGEHNDVEFIEDLNFVTKQRKGTDKARLGSVENPARITGKRATSRGKSLPSNRTRNANRSSGAADGGSIASPLTEISRTEVQRTVVSDDGLLDVTVADATEIIFKDANNNTVVFNLAPPA